MERKSKNALKVGQFYLANSQAAVPRRPWFRAWLRIDGERAAQVMHALLHAHQAQAAHPRRRRSRGRRLPLKARFSTAPVHHHLDAARLRMPRAVMQGFLHHAVDAGLELVGQLAGALLGRYMHAQTGALGNLASLPFERRHQAEIVQHGRAQQQSHVADHVDAGLGQFLMEST
jgi:hypothetical protein